MHLLSGRGCFIRWTGRPELICEDKQSEFLLSDRNNYFAFYPLFVEAGTGSLELRHAVIPIRDFLKETVFRMADATGIRKAGAGKDANDGSCIPTGFAQKQDHRCA